MSHRFLQALTCCLTCSLFFTGCSAPFQHGDGDGSGYLFTAYLSENPKNLDPQSATDAASKTVITNLFEGLLEQDASGALQCAGAASYTVSEDQCTYTFILRDQAYWYYDENQNDAIDSGETFPVTAYDYVFAFQRIFNPETQSPYRELFSCLQNADAIINGSMSYTSIGVTASSDKQLTFQLAYPSGTFLTSLTSTAAMPCSESFFERTKGRYGLDEQSVISNGAFYLRTWFYDPYGPDNLIYMRCNAANSAGRKVSPSNLTFRLPSKKADPADLFAKEDVDFYETAQYPDAYVSNSSYTVSAKPVVTLGLIFNPESKVFQNASIRSGLSLCIPRNTIGADSNGDVSGAAGLIPPAVTVGGTAFREQVAEPLASDSEEAVAQFQKGLQQLKMESLDTMQILVNTEDLDCTYLHEVTRCWQDTLGIYIGIEEVTKDQYEQRLQDGNYDLALYALHSTENDPAGCFRQYQYAAESLNWKESASLEQQIQDLSRTTSQEAYCTACAELEQSLLSQLYFVPIFYKNQYLVYRSCNKSIQYDPFAQVFNFRTAQHFE